MPESTATMQLQGAVVVEAFLQPECSAFMAGPLLATDHDGARRFTLTMRSRGADEQAARDVLLDSALRIYDALGETIDGLRSESA